MPRIYTSQNDPLDFCTKCFPREDKAIALYASLGEGPDEREDCFGWNEEHPDYEDADYECVKCHRPLDDRDN